MANKIKEIWQSGGAVVNGWLAIPSGFAAEFMARAGWDSVTVDLQHGVQDYMSMVQCFQAMQAHPVVPMVRVPWNEPGILGKVMDAGAVGVICPMISTVEQCRSFVDACRYPPDGLRSNGPIRAGIYGAGTAYQKTANVETLRIAMVETREAMTNLEGILDVPGLDAVYIGPSDLGFSHGLPPILDREEPEILRMYDRIIEQVGKRGLYAGVHCMSASYAKRAIGMGFKLVTINNDCGLMLQNAIRTVSEVRER